MLLTDVAIMPNRHLSYLWIFGTDRCYLWPPHRHIDHIGAVIELMWSYNL